MIQRSIATLFFYLTAMNTLMASAPAKNDSRFFPEILSRGMGKEKKTAERKHSVEEFCQKLKQRFAKYSWDNNPCGAITWQTYRTSVNGWPLIYWTFGTGKQSTLLLSGVHPDELTPVPMGFRLAHYIMANPKSFDSKKFSVIIAPLVNPDGFFKNTPSRTNSRGIDVNRNFNTSDWYPDAIKWWARKKFHSPRHFPGFYPNSEPETLFQSFLIAQYKPDKIVSIHAPLGFLDYDGPGDQVVYVKNEKDRKAKNLATSISQKIDNYRIVDYSFYPGSLGNYAGNEKKIPTVTLELGSTDYTKVDQYWRRFLPGILESIKYPFERFGYIKYRYRKK